MLPVLHPLHPGAGGEHLAFWALAGGGIGLVLVIGGRIVSALLARGDDGSDSEDP